MLLDNETMLFCPNGVPLKSWYKGIECPDSITLPMDPPVVFDLNADQGERYPLDINTLPVGVAEEVSNAVDEHKRTLVMAPPLLDDLSDDVVPCCNPPLCECVHL